MSTISYKHCIGGSVSVFLCTNGLENSFLMLRFHSCNQATSSVYTAGHWPRTVTIKPVNEWVWFES